MIEHLSGAVTFPINGVGLNVNLSLQPGITAIVGENGSGKTFTGSELPRWLLFGKKALRGRASDYVNLTGKGRFIIAGKPYTIERTPKKEEITDAKGTILAVGADAVTKKVEELFGYGLEVFDICNAAPQKKADMFGRKTPGERKRLIDRVIGLTSNEKVEKLCRDESRTFKREAEALTRQLREPVMPEKPADYEPSAELEKLLAEGREKRRASDRILDRVKPVWAPEKPIDPRPSEAEISDLQDAQDEFLINSRERARLIGILNECLAYDPADWTEDQLLAAEARLTAKLEIERRGPEPVIPLDEVRRNLDQWAVVAAYNAKPNTEVSCPKCDHKFLTAGDRPEAPNHSVAELRQQEQAHAAWAEPVVVPEGPDLTRKQIEHARASRAATERHDRAAQMLDDLPILKDLSEPLKTLRNAAASWAAYEQAKRTAAAQLDANIEAEREHLALGTVPEQSYLDVLADDVTAAKIYEAALAEAERVQTQFENLSVQIAEKNLMAEEYMKGANALADARAMVKSFLAPKLSVVASAILNDMTLGKLSSVVVDDDMEITVNSQRLETLSGAGETVANIALRVALGQVLVANTFPVFLGDEMDSDADDTRRQATAEAIRNLKSRLQQIVLITHRDVEIADYVINLNDTG